MLDRETFDAALKDVRGKNGMKSVFGTYDRRTKPMLQRQDSRVKKAIKSAMALSRKNSPKKAKLPTKKF